MQTCPDCGDTAPLTVTSWASLSPDHLLMHICWNREWIGYTVHQLDPDTLERL